jgi:RecG-like helicase
MDTHRRQAYSFVMKQILEGRQAFVVAPLIEESEKMTEILAATQLSEDLKQILPDARVELLHGKMHPTEKDAIMNRFRASEFDLLVSTTVIEVGTIRVITTASTSWTGRTRRQAKLLRFDCRRPQQKNQRASESH